MRNKNKDRNKKLTQQEIDALPSIWFTSDTHYGHRNIIEFCDRPFTDLEDMHEKMIANYNKLVQPGDDVYILGDFAFYDSVNIFRRLNGNKHLILGNHDKPNMVRGVPWCWVKDVYMLKVSPQIQIWLSHYAHRRWPKSHHGAYHLYGHSHNSIEDYGRSTDVGVDAWDYKPVSLKTLIAELQAQGRTDHH